MSDSHRKNHRKDHKNKEPIHVISLRLLAQYLCAIEVLITMTNRREPFCFHPFMSALGFHNSYFLKAVIPNEVAISVIKTELITMLIAMSVENDDEDMIADIP